MSENPQEPVIQPEPAAPESQAMVSLAGSAHPPEPSLSEEFREFGRQLSALLRVVRESPRAKEIETEVTHAMHDMEQQVTDALKTARQRIQEQKLQETFKGAAQTAADETQRGLVRGMRLVNEQLAHLVQETEKGRTQKPKGRIIEIESDEKPAPADAAETKPTEGTGEPPRYDPGI